MADRLRLLIEILDHEAMVLSWERDIYDQVKEQMDKNQRDYFLREQMRVISNELGEGESPADESMEFVEEIKALKHMPEETKEKLLKECDRLSRTRYNPRRARSFALTWKPVWICRGIRPPKSTPTSKPQPGF